MDILGIFSKEKKQEGFNKIDLKKKLILLNPPCFYPFPDYHPTSIQGGLHFIPPSVLAPSYLSSLLREKAESSCRIFLSFLSLKIVLYKKKVMRE